jgi:hypothetical protein
MDINHFVKEIFEVSGINSLIPITESLESGIEQMGGKSSVTVHGFIGLGVQGSSVQGSIFIPGLHLGCVFTRKASASSSLIQDLEPNRQLFEKMRIFNEDFGFQCLLCP